MAKENRYKDKTPEETVEAVKKVFADLSPDFCIKTHTEQGEKIGVYSNSLQLYYKDQLILGSNGKGMTKPFCSASGYAELYERFSNEMYIDGFIYPYTHPENYQNQTVESEISFFPQAIGCEEDVARFLKRDTGETLASEFTSISDSGNHVYLDARHLYAMCGSNGMAAGNTIPEALVQGLSELAERYVMNISLFMDNIQRDIYYTEISRELLKKEAPEAYEKTLEIEAQGFNIRYFDASECFDLPVVASLWVDKKRGIHATRLGAFPVFKIAIERCITENLQGRELSDSADYMQNGPFLGAGLREQYDFYTIGKALVPEILFLNNPVTNIVNTEVYASPNSTNKELLDFFIWLLEKKKFHVYWQDTSISNDIRSVHIHSPELNEYFLSDSVRVTQADADLLEEFRKNLGNIKKKSDAIKLLNTLDSNTILRRHLGYYYTDSIIKGYVSTYIKAILSFYLEEYEDALNALGEIKSENQFEYEPEIAALKTFAKYKAKTNLSDAQITERMKLWGYTPEELKIFFENDAEFIKKYLHDFVFENPATEKTSQIKNEIRDLIDNARLKVKPYNPPRARKPTVLTVG